MQHHGHQLLSVQQQEQQQLNAPFRMSPVGVGALASSNLDLLVWLRCHTPQMQLRLGTVRPRLKFSVPQDTVYVDSRSVQQRPCLPQRQAYWETGDRPAMQQG